MNKNTEKVRKNSPDTKTQSKTKVRSWLIDTLKMIKRLDPTRGFYSLSFYLY